MPRECPPILFITYSRPETTRKVFEAIRQARPSKLFISHDALPAERLNQPEYVKRHTEVREIVSAVDWPCEVKTLFFENNQGMKKVFKAAFDWFFEHVPEGIMLEDDEIPDQSYFPFCAEMLEKYRHDERVMCISGSNVLEHYPKPYREYSYYFLSIPCVWGMATWRRAWKHYDPRVSRWPEVRDSKILYKLLPTKASAFYFSQKFQGYYDGRINSWDGQWTFACLANKGLTIYSSTNLISNIGFNDASAFHGFLADSLWANLPLEPLSFPLKHPPEVAVNKVWDAYGVGVRYAKSNLTWRQKIKLLCAFSFPSVYVAAKKLYFKILPPKKYAQYNAAEERRLLP